MARFAPEGARHHVLDPADQASFRPEHLRNFPRRGRRAFVLSSIIMFTQVFCLHKKLRETIEMIYPELRRIAGSKLRKERANHTLDAHALTNEALMRVLKREQDGEDPRKLVLETLLEMRSVLVDYGRKRKLKVTDSLDQLEEKVGRRDGFENAVHVEMLLAELEKIDSRAAEVVRLRFFVGLTTEETAEFLGISLRMIQRDWAFARKWLAENWSR
ncbi:MAG: sigma-70 family RNA polymerase sigma factor [Bryobacter sp.]|nr:sigma-70 family RNA polymerase sigma factor [Bryobacter sp.]